MRGSMMLLLLTALLIGKTATAADLRPRPDWFVLEAGKVEVSVRPDTRQIAHVRASARLRNRTGVGVGLAIQGESTSIDTCTGQERSAGLAVIWPKDIERLRIKAESGKDVSQSLNYIVANASAKFAVTLVCNGEADQFPSTAHLGLSLVVAANKQVFVVPVSASDLPVRIEH